MRSAKDIEGAMTAHADAVWRACALHCASQADVQDAFQETFIKYAQADGTMFADDEHRKAWLLRVAINQCKDMLRARSRSDVSLDETVATVELVSSDGVVQPGSVLFEVAEALRSLDDPPRTPLYLSLCEGYTAPEIAEVVAAPVNTVYSWIARGKQQLREALS
uniref:RNA polymerase sigma factor n=1 Tax=Muribaculaceae bacterium Z82 TaxID=2304548 RepID=A0A7C9NU23_9BACT